MCDFEEEFQNVPCSSETNRICLDITRDGCPSGQYRGNHSLTSDSYCIPCQVHTTQYYGVNLHTFTGTGTIYNDAYSCPLQCSSASKLISPEDTSQGCESCEVGNVFFKSFRANQTHCLFDCRSGYIFRDGDCFPVAHTAEASLSLSITNALSDDADLYRFDVTHSKFGKFVVVVGQTRPTSCDHRQYFAGVDCCFAGLYRVSTLAQMGRVAAENCSNIDIISSTQHSDEILFFYVPTSRLEDIANCTIVNNYRDCAFYVSIIELLHSRTLTLSVLHRRHENQDVTFMNNAHEYIDMELFNAQVFRMFDTKNIYRVVIHLKPLRDMKLLINVAHAHSVQLSDIGSLHCSRMVLSQTTHYDTIINASSHSDIVWVSEWNYTLPVSVFRAHVVLMFDDTYMDVTVVRNVTQSEAVCRDPVTTKSIPRASVYSAVGLGRQSVLDMKQLNSTQEYTHGVLGSLVTFVAYAGTEISTHFELTSVLAVYASLNVDMAAISDATMRVSGPNIDFTRDFKAYCLNTSLCTYQYINRRAIYDEVYTMQNCSSGSKLSTKNWLKRQFGVPHEGGHVDALCSTMQTQTRDSTAFLVHTHSYLDNTQWNLLKFPDSHDTQTFLWATLEITT